MKPTGTGRIILWSGGSLWIGHAGEPTDFHAHHAVQITLPLAADGVRIRRPGQGWMTCHGAMIAANQPHAFEARGAFVGLIFVEPESRQGQAIQHQSFGDGVAPITQGILDGEIASLVDTYRRKAPDSELATGARAIISKLAGAVPGPEAVLDKRIKRALALLRERASESILLADIAEATFLSPDRFRHLFIEQTGIRFRPYVLWLRIETALAAFAANRSLTEAAQAGGFADSAHLSRTFKRMFGIAPSSFHRE